MYLIRQIYLYLKEISILCRQSICQINPLPNHKVFFALFEITSIFKNVSHFPVYFTLLFQSSKSLHYLYLFYIFPLITSIYQLFLIKIPIILYNTKMSIFRHIERKGQIRYPPPIKQAIPST